MNPQEILTLQLGHYSNFVGTHWWNLQELSFQYDPDTPSDINHDILYREGLTHRNEITFTPRLLSVDLKGSLRTLSQGGELYHTSNSPPPPDSIEIKKEIFEKNQFLKDLETGAFSTKKIYDLDTSVQVWSDYLYTRLHPRSVNIVNKYEMNNENSPFDLYPLGRDLWKSQEFSEEFCDKIRNYIEECDNLQGFHALIDSTDAFSGLASSCVEHLQDEYSTKAVLSFPVIPYVSGANIAQLINLGLCYQALSEHSQLSIPLSVQTRNYSTREFHFTSYNPELPYHSSAILASALDTFTLNYRLKSSNHSLGDLTSDLSAFGRKFAGASLCLPFGLRSGEDFIDCLDKWEGPLFKSVSPNCEIAEDKNLQVLVLRGVPETRLKRPRDVETKQRDMPAYNCESLKDMLGYYMQCTSFGSKTSVFVTGEKLAVKTPFPKIFSGEVGRDGDVMGREKGEVEGVSVLSGVHSGRFVGGMFDVLCGELEKVKIKKYPQFESSGLEVDEFQECCHKLLDLRDCYSDSDSI